MKNNILRIIFLTVITIAMSYAVIYARNGLQATDGDTLDANHWNQLVNKINGINDALTNNVGIGTATPTQKLDVNGTIKATSFQGDGSQLTGIGGGVPSGAIMAFYLSSCPSGWILANGANSTPDLRGAFIRGMGGDANSRDVARTLGDYQTDELKSHTHQHKWNAGGIGSCSEIQMSATCQGYADTLATGGTETRPKNVALIYCMKQ